MRRPIVFLLLAGLAAGLASLVVYSSLKKKDEEVRLAMAGTVPIVVAAHDIPVGAKIDSSAIKFARWPRNALPAGAATDASSVIGDVTRAEIVESEPIVTSRLITNDKTSGVLPLMIPPDMRAMSVAVDEVADLAGFVLPFTKVDVLLSVPATDKQPERSKIILENVPVLAVAQTVQRKDNPQPERVVTLLVSPEDAERLAVASTQGKLHLALRGYGDNSIVPTSGADVHKVMNSFGAEIPQPVAQPQQPAPVRIVRTYYRPPRPRRPAHVELLRNGSSRESIPIGADGRALAGAASAAAGSNDGSPSAYAASLGDDNSSNGAGSADNAMAADSAGVSQGMDK